MDSRRGWVPEAPIGGGHEKAGKNCQKVFNLNSKK